MFIYEDSTLDGQTPLAWFSACDRSVYEIALFFQNGLLNRRFIKNIRFSKRLQIAVVNSENYKLTIGDKYNLLLSSTKTPGYMKLDCIFEDKEFFGSWYNICDEELKTVKSSTWKALFGNPTAPFPLPKQSIEFYDVQQEERHYSFNRHSQWRDLDYKDVSYGGNADTDVNSDVNLDEDLELLMNDLDYYASD